MIVMLVKPVGMMPLTVIEFGCVAAPAIALLHTLALKVVFCPGWKVVPPALVKPMLSAGGTTVGCGVGVNTGLTLTITVD